MSISSSGPLGGFPPPDPNDGGLPDWFNPNVDNDMLNPYQYPGDDIMTKLYRMIEWMKDNPSNKTAPQMFLLFLSNLENKGVFQKYPQLLQQIMNIKADGKSIVSQIINIEVEQNFFDGGDKDAFFSFLNTLFSGSDALDQAVRDRLADWNFHWADFVKLNTGPDGKPIYTEDQFNMIASGMWGDFMLDSNASEWERDMRMSMIQELSKNQIFKENPMILLMLLIFLLSDSSTTDQIGGFGNTSKWLKGKTDDMGGISNQWGSPFASGADAKSWMDQIEKLKFEVDHSPLAKGIKDQIDSQLGSILNTQALDNNGQGIYMADGKTPVTIQDLNDGYTDNTVSPPKIYGPQPLALAISLNDFLPKQGLDPKGDPYPVPPQYQTFLNNLKSAGSSFSDQSQVVATMISQLSSTSQASDNNLNKFLNDDTGIVGLEKVAVQNQIRS